MKTGTILATLVAAGAIAAGTINQAAGAATVVPIPGCNVPAFYGAVAYGAKMTTAAMQSERYGLYETAAAYEMDAWRKLRFAPIPCLPVLRTARTHYLNMHADYWRSAKTYANPALSTQWLYAGNHEGDLAEAAIVSGSS